MDDTQNESWHLSFWSRLPIYSVTNDRTGLISIVSTRLIDSDSQTPVLRYVLVGDPISTRTEMRAHDLSIKKPWISVPLPILVPVQDLTQ